MCSLMSVRKCTRNEGLEEGSLSGVVYKEDIILGDM